MVYSQVTENDSFPQNICTKCETTMFDAFMFKQKSVKSHHLLQKILKISHEEGDKAGIEPITTERKSQATQTQTSHDAVQTEIDTESMVTEEINKIELQFTEEEEEEDEENADDVWQFIYDNEEISATDENDRETEQIEIISEAPDEVSSQSTEPTQNTVAAKSNIDCEHCGEVIPLRQWQGHVNKHTKLKPYLLNSTEFFRCSRCFSTFPFIDNLFEHMNAEEGCEPSASAELAKTDACTDYQFLANDTPIRLYSASKNDDSNTYSCSLCLLDFEDMVLFQTHFGVVHLSNADCNAEYLRADLVHSCGICGDSFNTLHDALHHVYFHQSIFSCVYEDCEQFFGSFSTLYIHFTNQHTESKAKCSHCNYSAKDTDDLKAHQRSSCTARNLKCDLCGGHLYLILNIHILRPILMISLFFNRKNLLQEKYIEHAHPDAHK